MSKSSVVLLASLLVAGPALAQAGTNAGTGLAQPEQPATEKKVCKRVSETGSFARVTKVCLTKAEWEGSARGHQGYAQDLQNKLRTKPGGQ